MPLHVALVDPTILGWVAVIVVLDAVALVRAVVRAHGVESTLAWMFAILAFPGVGALAYLALANPSIRRTTRRKRAWMETVRGAADPEVAAPEHGSARAVELAGELPRGSLERLLYAVTGLRPTAGNALELLDTDARAFAVLERELRGARRSIWAEYYDVHDDDTGQRFLAILAEKAAEGVEVRFLVDGVGSLSMDEDRIEAVRRSGAKVRVFLPFNPLRRRWAVNLRNHRKLVVVDGTVALTGGMNVGDEYSGRARRRGKMHFRDSHLRLRGPAVHDLALIFAEDWTFATEDPLEPPPRPKSIAGAEAVVAVVPGGPDQPYSAISLAYFGVICAATERVWLSSPYFMPDEPTSRALVSAVLRGIDVRVLVPRKADVALVGPASRSYYGPLLRAGVRIFEYVPSMLHTKSVVVDSVWGVVGSANLDMRSFRLNFELSAMVRDPAFAAALETSFLADLEHSEEVALADVLGRSFVERLKVGGARLLSPLL